MNSSATLLASSAVGTILREKSSYIVMSEDKKEAQRSVSVLQTLLKHNTNKHNSYGVNKQAHLAPPKSSETTDDIGPTDQIIVPDYKNLKNKAAVCLDDVVADGVVLPHGQYETVLRPRIFKRKAVEGKKPKMEAAPTKNGQRRSLFPTSQKKGGEDNLISNLPSSDATGSKKDEKGMNIGDDEDEDENDYYENECAGEDLSLGMKLTMYVMNMFCISQIYSIF